MTSESEFHLEVYGFCPLCGKRTRFVANHPWLRDHLNCMSCPGGSLPRERALALVLERLRPNWRDLAIHESSPAKRGLSAVLDLQAAKYVGTHFFPMQEAGAEVDGYRNEDLEQQTFPNDSFDIVITQDVFEHLFHPDRALSEIHRTLKPDGVLVSTFPIHGSLTAASRERARMDANGSVEHILPAEYHGNPIDEKGALVTHDFGYGIHRQITEWSGFDVEITRFCKPSMGILGEYTEVIVCTKA